MIEIVYPIVNPSYEPNYPNLVYRAPPNASQLDRFFPDKSGILTCLRPNGQAHVQLRPTGDVATLLLSAVRVLPPFPLDLRNLPPSQEVGS